MSMLKTRKEKLSIGFYLIWSAPGIGFGIISILLGYITYFATNVLGLSPGLVGMLIFASKIFDGFTDVIAGFVIDKTNTRFGRARPYDFAGVMLCLFTVILFGIPKMGQTQTAVYIFVIYTIIFSVWSTLISCAGPVYLARAVKNDEDRVSVGTLTGMIASVASIAVSVFLPTLIEQAGNSREEWLKISLLLGIPCMILCVLRFFLIKEVTDTNTKSQVAIKVSDGVYQLFHNKYVLLFALALLMVNISNSTSQAAPYYFQYIAGDLSLLGLTAAGGVAGPLALIFFPVLSKRLGLKGIIQVGLLLGVVGRLIPLFGLDSIPLLMIGAIFNGIAVMPMFVLAGNVVINCMDYGQWKFGKRGEGIYTCVIGFCSKVGVGLAAALIGIATAVSGFDGSQVTQSHSANLSIILLYTVIPAVIFIIAMAVMHFYNLDKLLPQIREELDSREEGELE